MSKDEMKKKTNLNIFLIYILVIITANLVFYPLFPLILNYPPDSINTQFDKEFSKILYYQQYIIINLLIAIFGFIFLKLAFKGVDKWDYIVKSVKEDDKSAIEEIRKKSFMIPHTVCIFQILIPVFLIGIMFFILGFRDSADIKFFIILVTFLSLSAVISYLFSKKYFRNVLMFTYNGNCEKRNTRIRLPVKITLQILPLLLLSIIFVALVGQSGLIKEKGNAVFNNYHRELMEKFKNSPYIYSEEQIKKCLNEVKIDNKNDITFYIDPHGGYKTLDNSMLSTFFLKYTKELAFKYSGHTYDYYGSDFQGAVIKLKGVDGDWILGVKYEVTSSETITFFIISIIVITLFAFLILLYFAKTIADDIALIASGLTEIAEGAEADLNKRIAVTSNDEIGDLAVAFNKVQEREKKYVQDIKNQQTIIVERERLASLGQMISGITHNLKTPIMSLLVAITSTKDLVAEYQASIGDRRVTPDDHREIAADMAAWLNEMTSYCTYMNDVLMTIKGQIVLEKPSQGHSFTLQELMKRIEILTDYELTKSGCSINHCIKVNPDLEIPGEASNLVQVLENIIANSIQAYQGKVGVIQLTVTLKDHTLLEFCIRDSGKGIPAEIQKKLFKEMITTKGKKGTGLGLYISYAIIKGKFGGDLWFESSPGQGTSFYISIPI